MDPNKASNPRVRKYLSSEIHNMLQVQPHDNVVHLMSHALTDRDIIMVLEKCDCSFGHFVGERRKKWQQSENMLNMNGSAASSSRSHHRTRQRRTTTSSSSSSSSLARRDEQKCVPILSEPELQFWLSQLLTGLSHVHDHKIIHRDVKADNLLMRGSVLKIADFGLSKLLEDHNDLTRTHLGTPLTMAPEFQARERNYGKSVDLWAVGCVLLECITPEYKHLVLSLKNKKMSLSSIAEHLHQFRVSNILTDLCLGLLQSNPDLRLTCREALDHPFFVSQQVPTRIIDVDTHQDNACQSSDSPPHIAPPDRCDNLDAVGLESCTTTTTPLPPPPATEVCSQPIVTCPTSPPEKDAYNAGVTIHASDVDDRGEDASEHQDAVEQGFIWTENKTVLRHVSNLYIYRNRGEESVRFPLSPNRQYLISVHNDGCSYDIDLCYTIQVHRCTGDDEVSYLLSAGEISRGTYVQATVDPQPDPFEVQVICKHSYSSRIPYSLFDLGIRAHVCLCEYI